MQAGVPNPGVFRRLKAEVEMGELIRADVETAPRPARYHTSLVGFEKTAR